MRLFKEVLATEAEILTGLKKLGSQFEPATREDVRAAHEDNEQFTDGELTDKAHAEAADKLGKSPMETPAAKAAKGVPAYNLAEPDETTVKPSATPEIDEEKKTTGEREFDAKVPDPEIKPLPMHIAQPVPVMLVKPKGENDEVEPVA